MSTGKFDEVTVNVLTSKVLAVTTIAAVVASIITVSTDWGAPFGFQFKESDQVVPSPPPSQ